MPYEYVVLQKVNRSGGNESYIEKISEENKKLAQESQQLSGQSTCITDSAIDYNIVALSDMLTTSLHDKPTMIPSLTLPQG